LWIIFLNLTQSDIILEKDHIIYLIKKGIKEFNTHNSPDIHKANINYFDNKLFNICIGDLCNIIKLY
jgi:hypothetical protein